jgi:hypothetical protein
MRFVGRLVLCVVLALAAGCGDDEPSAKPDASDATPDASDAKPDAGDGKPDAGDPKPDAGGTKPDASDSKDCPASGEPAVAGCPCFKPRGDYCCGVGSGMSCGRTMIWSPFDDSPCHPDDEDAGPMIECRR